MSEHGKKDISYFQSKASFGDMAHVFDSLFTDVNNLTYLEALSHDHILKQYGVHSVLDCACGTGIQSIGLAQMGYRIFASDISRKMIEELRVKARRKGIKIISKQADFRDLKPWKGSTFDAVICSGNSITLVPNRKDVYTTLQSMRQVTRTMQGAVIIGLHNYPKLRRESQVVNVRWIELNGKRQELVVDLRFLGKERAEITYLFVKKIHGKYRLASYTKSYLSMSAEELRNIMLRAGFASVKLFDISGKKEFNDDEWLLAVGETQAQ